MACSRIARLAFFNGHTIYRCDAIATQGKGHRTFLVQSDKGAYIVRFQNRTDKTIDNECALLREISKLGIAPMPLWCDVKEQVSILRYVAGEPLSLPVSSGKLSRIAATLMRLHRFKSRDAGTVDWEVYKEDEGFTQAYERIKHFSYEPVLCHNDLNTGNVLHAQNGDIVLLDWEYAGINDRYFDLASFIEEFSLDTRSQTVFLTAYFGGSWDEAKLEAYRHFYRIVCERWEWLFDRDAFG